MVCLLSFHHCLYYLANEGSFSFWADQALDVPRFCVSSLMTGKPLTKSVVTSDTEVWIMKRPGTFVNRSCSTTKVCLSLSMIDDQELIL